MSVKYWINLEICKVYLKICVIYNRKLKRIFALMIRAKKFIENRINIAKLDSIQLFLN